MWRIAFAVILLVGVSEEELDKDSDENSKASFLLCQVIDKFSNR